MRDPDRFARPGRSQPWRWCRQIRIMAR